MEKKSSFVTDVNQALLAKIDGMNAWLKKRSLSLERIVGALFAALMISYAYQLLVNGRFESLEAYYNSINFVFFIPIALVGFGAMLLLTVRMSLPSLIPWCTTLFSALVSILWIHNYSGEDKGQFVLGVGVFDLVIALWLIRGNKLGIPGTEAFGKKLRDFADGVKKSFRSPAGKANAAKAKPHLTVSSVVSSLLAGLVTAHVFQLITRGAFQTLEDYFGGMNVGVYLLTALGICAVLLALTALLKTAYIAPWALMAFTVALNCLMAFFAQGYKDGDRAYFALGLGLVDLLIAFWLSCGDKLGIVSLNISRRAALIAGAVMFVATALAFGYFTMLRYNNYTTYTFDFGIFAQMYERMAQTGLPYTTVERSYMMLHYGVHFSPFFYLFLPGYYLFRSPVYLFFIQAAGVAAGVFGVWLLAGKLGLSGKLTLALEALYIFYPCLFNGTFYDFHENKFLTAVILFLFYFIISKRPVGILVFSLLLLSIKEDAALYLMVIAVFVLINRREIFTGVVMLAMAVVYFIIAQKVVAATGVEGVMMDRLQNYFINGEQTFGSVVKAIVFDLGHTISQVFTAEKLPFAIWMLGCVLFAPFMTNRISSLVLLLPILPINMMQSRSYQYNVDYQYTYGVAALIIVASILIFIKLGPVKRRAVVIAALCISMTMTLMLTVPKIKTVTDNAEKYSASYAQVDEVLDRIPDDATVTASDAFVPHLYRIKWLFTVPEYYEKNWSRNPIRPDQADYVVVDTRYRSDPKRAERLKNMMGDNYTLVSSGGFAELYERKVKVKVAE